MIDTTVITSKLQGFENILPILVIFLSATTLLAMIMMIILRASEICRLIKQETIFLELTPPDRTDRSLAATQHLFGVLHGMKESRTLKDKLLLRRVVFSLEIVSTREKGIRYLMRVAADKADTFEHTLAAYLPETKINRVENYLPAQLTRKNYQVLSFIQTNHFAYPLKTTDERSEHDPVAYINGMMSQLEPNELIALQIVTSPANVRQAGVIQNKLVHNEALVTKLGKKRLPASKILDALGGILFSITDTIGDVHHGPARSQSPEQRAATRNLEVSAKIRPARTLSNIEQELAIAVNNKLQQPLFSSSIRAFVLMNSKQRLKRRASGLRNTLDAFKNSKYQALHAKFSMPFWHNYRLWIFSKRLPSIFISRANVLAASELSSIYHFPDSQLARTEDVVKSLSKTLPAPLSLKNNPKFDVVLGRNYHLGQETDIGLTAAERERHVFIVGGTGNGKTTLIKYSIIQDIQNGKGVAVLDPHGDLAQEILAYIPEERINDVIYFNPSDLAYPIGLNLLEMPEGLTGDELADAKDFIAETVVSIMRKTFSDNGTGGHRIEYILRNAILTALTVKDATLFTVYDLLTDGKFRKSVVTDLEQGWLKNFWKSEYGKAGDYQQVKMMSGVTTKIGRYHASVSADRILNQPKSTINFEEILDGKILICNLAKGLVGEDTSEILGISILAKLQLASFQRIKQDRSSRKPFYAYVDEFQNFATVSFVEMLSEARKYKLFLTMAEQTTAQQEDQRIVNTILANAGTIICFKTNSPDDEDQMLRLLNQQVQKGEVMNLPTYNFYIRLAGTTPQEPTSGMTLLPPNDGDETVAKKVIAASKKNYAYEYKEQPKTIVKNGRNIIRRHAPKRKQNTKRDSP